MLKKNAVQFESMLLTYSLYCMTNTPKLKGNNHNNHGRQKKANKAGIKDGLAFLQHKKRDLSIFGLTI